MTWRISGSGLYNAFTTTSDSPALARCCATSSYATRSLPSRQLFASAFVVHVQRHGGDTDGSAVRDVEREPLGGGGGAHGGAHGGGAMSLMGGGGGAAMGGGGGAAAGGRGGDVTTGGRIVDSEWRREQLGLVASESHKTTKASAAAAGAVGAGAGGGATTSSGGGESCEKRMLSLLASTPTHKDRVKGLLATLDFEVGWQCRFHIL